MVGDGNGRHPPLLCPLDNILYLRDAVHIAHLGVAVELHPLFQAGIHPLAGKILALFYAHHRSQGQLMVKAVDGGNAADLDEASLHHRLVHILHHLLTGKQFYGNGIGKVRHIKDNNAPLAAPQFPLLHCQNLSAYGHLSHLSFNGIDGNEAVIEILSEKHIGIIRLPGVGIFFLALPESVFHTALPESSEVAFLAGTVGKPLTSGLSGAVSSGPAGTCTFGWCCAGFCAGIPSAKSGCGSGRYRNCPASPGSLGCCSLARCLDEAAVCAVSGHKGCRVSRSSLLLSLPCLNAQLAFHSRHIGKFHFRRQAAPLLEDLFQYPFQLSRLLFGHHGILNGHPHPLRLRKINLRLPEHGIFNDAVMLQLQKNAVLIYLQKLFWRILAGQTVLLLDPDNHLLIRKKLFLNAFLQVVYHLLMDQPWTFDINANRASIPGGGHTRDLHQF